jgi:eukaryotic-like serine/threonine-protein kinase
VRKTSLTVSGLPDAETTRLFARELQSVRQILDVKMISDNGKFELQLAEGSASDLIDNALIKPLNTKLGQSCFSIGAVSESDVNVTFAKNCASPATRTKMESAPPAGVLNAPPSRSKSLLKSA